MLNALLRRTQKLNFVAQIHGLRSVVVVVVVVVVFMLFCFLFVFLRLGEYRFPMQTVI